MPRTTIRAKIPDASAASLLHLLETIVAKHEERETAHAGSSPIEAADITAVKEVIAIARPARTKAEDLSSQAAVLFEQSNNRLGLAEGQNSRSTGTGLFLASKIRDGLLATYRGAENELEPFGFNVVIGSAALPKRQAAALKT